MPYCIIDIECLRGRNGDLIIKEMAIVNPYTRQVQSFLFRAPYSWKCLPAKVKGCNRWLTDCLHGLRWDDGYIPYHELKGILSQATKNCVIYAKGVEKVKLLAGILNGEV